MTAPQNEGDPRRSRQNNGKALARRGADFAVKQNTDTGNRRSEQKREDGKISQETSPSAENVVDCHRGWHVATTSLSPQPSMAVIGEGRPGEP